MAFWPTEFDFVDISKPIKFKVAITRDPLGPGLITINY